MTSTTKMPTTLVVGATGATGHHVVQLLLNHGRHVRVIARSKERMLNLLDKEESHYGDRLEIIEASLLKMSDAQLDKHVKNCEAVVSCLGHNMTVRGIWGRESRRLVTDATKRLVNAIKRINNNNNSIIKTKFILMGTDAVAHPDGYTDDRRSFMERSILFLLRHLVPPHADNEEAAAYLFKTNRQDVHWSIVRPTDLVDGNVGKYDVFDKPQGSLFGAAGVTTRANVAHFMVEQIMDDAKWKRYKHQMPVVIDTPSPEESTTNKKQK